jgi:Ca2+-transporting ATPase
MVRRKPPSHVKQMQPARTLDMIKEHGSSVSKGLSDSAAEAKLKKCGPNAFARKKRRSFIDIMVAQASNSLILLLFFATMISIMLQHYMESVAIFAAIMMSVLFSSFLEHRADDAMEQLLKYRERKVIAIRNGRKVVLDSESIVPGDILILESGQIVPADCIIIESKGVTANESVLTGESLPVEKVESSIIHLELPVHRQKSMLFSGTSIASGICKAMATRTGMSSEFGKIAGSLNIIEKGQSTLSLRVEDLGKKISIVSTLIILGLLIFGAINGRDMAQLFIFSVALAVAAIPEGLPTTLVIMLALGVKEMAKSKAVVKRLSSIETIGSIDVIATDKTGTITEGKFALGGIFIPFRMLEKKEWKDVLSKAVVCTHVTSFEGEMYGDELDVEVVNAAQSIGILARDGKIVEPFSSNSKRMVAERNGQRVMKGAPEVVIKACSRMETDDGITELDEDMKEELSEAVNEFSKEGFRAVALAFSEWRGPWIFSALMLFRDPPREGVAKTIKKMRNAGITVIMITGDNKYTARAIARDAGVIGQHEEPISWESLEGLTMEELYNKVMLHRVIARATPDSKLKIVEAMKAMGHIVAVTGDGINDAPALKSANVGVAMGIRGTDASKEIADIVLLDDNFSTLFSAITYGRSILRNISNFVRFQLTTNISAILLTVFTFITNLPLALGAIQLLWINIIMDGPPAVAQAFEKPGKNLETEKPKKAITLLTVPMMLTILFSGVFISLVAFHVFQSNLGYGETAAATMAFNLFVFMQLFNAFAVRSPSAHFWENLINNKVLIAMVATMAIIQIAINYVPIISTDFFRISPIPVLDLAMIIVLSSSVLFLDEVRKSLRIWTSA